MLSPTFMGDWDDDPFDSGYAEAKSDTGFVGISNQGATCYMNSLLQTLYMTPEFRRALYQWEYNPEVHPEEHLCIPFQLQRLFAHLQLSERASIETKALTKSFGWDASDAFEQHDIQELCRVLFDALEQCFKGTPQENVINELWQGTMVDYIKCKSNSEHQRLRHDKYLDIPLVIKGITSIEESIRKFISPETLDEDNQWFCEACNCKVDALKGLSLEEDFPHILCLQLKRFDFDYQSLMRIKLNDEVSFPMYLDVNAFLPNATRPASRNRFPSVSSHDASSTEEEMPEDSAAVAIPEQDSSSIASTPSAGTPLEKKTMSMLEQGDRNIYELYSILIHSGSALGGHYYAYIKDMSQGKWFEFNDSRVTELTDGDIEKTFGGSCSNWSFSRSANAYMLMYRRRTLDELAAYVVADDVVPARFHTELAEENAALLKKVAEQERKLAEISVSVCMNGEEKNMCVDKTVTMAEFKLLVMQRFAIEDDPMDVRIRNFQKYNNVDGEPFDESQEAMTFEQLEIGHYTSFTAEVRTAGEMFEEWRPDQMMLRIIVLDRASEEYLPAFMIHVSKNCCLLDVKELIAGRIGMEPANQRVIELTSTAMELEGDYYGLKQSFHIFDGDTLHIEFMEDRDDESIIERKFQEERNFITLNFNNPSPVDQPDPDFPHSLVIDRRLTLADLRARVAEKFELAIDSFKIRRGHALGNEFKDDTSDLILLRLHDGSSLYIQMGRPCKPSEFKLNFSLFEARNDVDTVTPLFSLPINEKILVSDLKAVLSAKCGIPASLMRLRDRFSQRVGKIYKDGGTLKDNVTYPFDGKEVAIQRIDVPDDLRIGDVVIHVQLFTINTWSLGPVDELVVSLETSQWELCLALAAKFNIPEDDIELAKPYTSSRSFLDSVGNLDWEGVAPGDMRTAKSEWPLYDGDTLLVRARHEECLPPPTETEPPRDPGMVARRAAPARDRGLKINIYAKDGPTDSKAKEEREEREEGEQEEKEMEEIV